MDDFVISPCRGMRGTASMDSLSLGTPCSTSLSDVTLSAAEKPILLVSSTAIIVGISGSRTIFHSSAYVSNSPWVAIQKNLEMAQINCLKMAKVTSMNCFNVYAASSN